ncbi:hypothetical protein M419DRAFT_84013 [Trichoderma reesei RUT C-30]|uniref:DUF8035 domain-containing protein n=1 Tax=Hypocrea jecorina (strain ATCC 56765 / BCRC 32924 / NRRL 11460 / Rut C-30) TaxID=1344414 RepID=A0A024S7B9_HYPJR|nr:hypothetical protein M419DRAFT_84013 [Trichoderma reesei RUT C-30]
MADRYRGYPAAGRSATFNNPARISLPAGVGGYGALYANDPDYVASPTRYSAATPRGYTAAAAPAAVAVPPRSYSTVNPEPRAPRPSPREPSRTRRSTLDASARPPIIVTSMQDHRPHTSTPLTADVLTHGGSPVREPYRASDGRLYSQPASSIRSRSTARPYHTSSASDDFGRSREQGEIVLASRDADAYRSSRPHVVYPSNSRHSNAAIDYGDDGYQYTNAGELVRYDLDHGAAPAPARSRRHDSFDRTYSRPNINYNADQRSFNVNTTLDPNRASRIYDSRGGGPPPSTRGFDKIGRAYESARDVPPAAPAPPNLGQPEVVERPVEQRTIRRPRPLSLTQEPGRAHPDDYYRGYDDDGYEPRRFYDDSVTSRGFGLRVGQPDDVEDHRGRYWESRDDLGREEPTRRDHSRKRIEAPVKEGQRPHDEDERGSDHSDQEDSDRSRVREKVASGVAAGAATAAAAAGGGLSPNSKKDAKPESSEARRRRASDEASERDEDRDRQAAKAEAEARERNRREAEAKLNGESAIVSSDSDEGKKKAERRHRPSNSFDPNDTGDLKQIREQLAKTSDGEKPETNGKDKAPPPEKDKEERRSASPAGEDDRGRDLVLRNPEEKQVRVVSPPREKKEEKPLKGILKQPSAKFPEELNPIREGVAPHKEDKKLKEVPPGARWTKINRKIVNPEALEIGKERYELRDDFVIVLRVLSKEEIQAYAAATQVLRDYGREYDREYDRDYDREYDDDRGRRASHRHRRHRDDADLVDPRDQDRDRDRDRDRERRRRHRRDEDDDYESRSRDLDHHHHHRSHREI